MTTGGTSPPRTVSWHWPLQEAPLWVALLLLFGVPAGASFLALFSLPSVYDLSPPYVLALACAATWLEVWGSEKLQVCGAGAIVLAAFRNLCLAGFCVALGAIAGFLGGWAVLLAPR